jgi:type I site-specific restriction endonuclease
MDKKQLTEADIRTKFITPALVGTNSAKWNVMTQLREEVFFTKGRVIVRGKTVRRGEAKKADYILYFKPGVPIAVIEAKDNNHSVGAGMQQALEYAEILDLTFAYSCNGDAFLEHDRTGSGSIKVQIVDIALVIRPHCPSSKRRTVALDGTTCCVLPRLRAYGRQSASLVQTVDVIQA